MTMIDLSIAKFFQLALLGPITATCALLLFPRQMYLYTWSVIKWAVEKAVVRFMNRVQVGALRRMLVEQNPAWRKDWFWQERGSALVTLVLQIGLWWWLYLNT